MNKTKGFLLFAFILLVTGGCRKATPAVLPQPAEGVPSFVLTSPAFTQGSTIPRRYTCDGEDISPPLEWRGWPEGTASFALVVDDPDAPSGVWCHWLLYDLPPETHALAEAVPTEAELPDGSRQGNNSWRRLGYGGPCPPSGTHRYFFRLYALDIKLGLPSGASKEQLLQAMEGHILAQAELMGRYSRQ